MEKEGPFLQGSKQHKEDDPGPAVPYPAELMEEQKWNHPRENPTAANAENAVYG